MAFAAQKRETMRSAATAEPSESMRSNLMSLDDLLSPDAIAPSLKAGGKKQALQDLAARAGKLAGLPERLVFDTLLQREHLGSTGLGQGVAVPHGRVAGLERMFGYFARLEKPIAFDAVDDEPVDLIFLLLGPESAGADHLKALARVARVFRSQGVAAKLRATADRDALYAVLTQAAAPNAA